MSVVNCCAYSKGVKSGDIPIDDISELIKVPDHFVWVGLHEPNHELLLKMQEEFHLHELAVEDALRAHQRPKLEHYGDAIFVVLRTAELVPNTHEVVFGETHLFVGPRYLLSVRHASSLSFAAVRARCEANPDLLKQGPAFVLYALMDFIVDQYFPVIDVEFLEERLFNDKFDRLLTERIYVLKRRIIEVKRALIPLIDVCNQLTRFDQSLVQESTRLYFRDVYDHVMRLNEMTDALRDLLSAALEANLAMVSVAQSEVTKQLASYGAIIAVPTMIAGVYGMNFEHMPELKEVWGYPAVLVLIAVVCSFLYWRFKKSGWL
jgi:magnesium transporter